MENYSSIDTMWVLLATSLVFLMQLGFAMVETRFTRAKNAGNIIMKNLMDLSIGSVIFWLFGFSLMFGMDIWGLSGTLDIFSYGTYKHLGLSIPKEAFIIFQTVFCATAATIVSGSMAERTKFTSYIIYSIVISGFIYPVAGHWAWGGGWLSNLGFHDFAGSSVVHSVGGWAALIGAKLIGPRIGKYTDGRSNEIMGHSITLGALGVFILWFGWFGFNPGSTLSIGDPGLVSRIFMTTNIAGAGGAIAAMTYTWITKGKPDVGLTLNGALGGLVGVTAGTDVFSPGAALLIGSISGMLVVVVSKFVDEKMMIDDSVSAFAVHGACGIFGTIMVGFFAKDVGYIYSGNTNLLVIQIVGAVAIGLWAIISSSTLFYIIKNTIGLRVEEHEEITGLDLLEHGLESSYPEFAPREIEA